MKFLLFILSIFLTASSVAAQENVPDIRNFLRVNKDFCTGGQPRLEHLEKLKADGVKSIINLRQPSDIAPRKKKQSERAGLALLTSPGGLR